MPSARSRRAPSLPFALVGWLFFVEIVSGILQGYYIPILTPLARHLGIDDAQVNWLEAAQLLLSSIAVPVLAKLGDMIGHKRILLISSAVTALGSWMLVVAGNFPLFLVGWAVQGFYVVWLPLEIAIIFSRARTSGVANATTRRAAGLLVVALQAGAIAGALLGGRLLPVFGGELTPTLVVPAVAVSAVFFVVLLGVPKTVPDVGERRLDSGGFALLTLGLLLLMGALTFLRINGPGAWFVWVLLAVGIAVFIPFVLYERRQSDPAIDLRVLTRPTMWPVQLTAGLFGISVLGAQVPLSTFVATDPANGYGLGLASDSVSNLIGAYLLSVIIGAILFPFIVRWTTPRHTLIGAALLVGIGYLLFLPLHGSIVEVLTNMMIAGLGTGALLAALPSAAASAAPIGQTGIATGLTNTTKTVGGAFASAIFGVALASGVTSTASTAGSLAGYFTVWILCGGTALVAAALLLFVPKLAFSDPAAGAVGDGSASDVPTPDPIRG